jgi:septal ring factor EnvC (AmiA/AmiB activator)
MVKPKTTLAAALAALFPISGKAISEKLTQEEFNSFGTEVQEAQDRLDAQAQGNEAVAADLKAAETRQNELQAELTTASNNLTKAQGDLTNAQTLISQLEPKAGQWDAHQAALKGSAVIEDSTNVKPKSATNAGLSDKDQSLLDRKAELKAKYPGLMADIDVPVQEA